MIDKRIIKELLRYAANNPSRANFILAGKAERSNIWIGELKSGAMSDWFRKEFPNSYIDGNFPVRNNEFSLKGNCSKSGQTFCSTSIRSRGGFLGRRITGILLVDSSLITPTLGYPPIEYFKRTILPGVCPEATIWYVPGNYTITAEELEIMLPGRVEVFDDQFFKKLQLTRHAQEAGKEEDGWLGINWVAKANDKLSGLQEAYERIALANWHPGEEDDD